MSANRFLAAIALLLIQLLPAAAAGGSLAVQEKKISDKGATFTLEFAYPHTGNQTVDREIEGWVKDLAKGFKDDVKEQEASKFGPYTAGLGYEVARNDGAMFG